MRNQGSHFAIPVLLALASTVGGCSLPPALHVEGRQPEKVRVTAEFQDVSPVQPSRVFPDESQAIYRNPKIGVVYLRAHQDSEGRLLGPQIMYQVVDPGGWNIQALEGGNGYLPAANTHVPAIQMPSVPEDEPLQDPDAARSITITGLMSQGDRSEAEEMAAKAGGCAAVYDKQAGWLLIPVRKP
jgi:hypothetical protein